VEPGTFPQATTYEKGYGRRSAHGHFPQSFSASRFTAAASGFFDLSPSGRPALASRSQPRLDLQLRSIHRHGLRQCFIVLRRAYELFTRFETGHRSSTPSSAGVKISRPASFPSHGVNWSGSSTTGMRS
jgi:hypothetical protein